MILPNIFWLYFILFLLLLAIPPFLFPLNFCVYLFFFKVKKKNLSNPICAAHIFLKCGHPLELGRLSRATPLKKTGSPSLRSHPEVCAPLPSLWWEWSCTVLVHAFSSTVSLLVHLSSCVWRTWFPCSLLLPLTLIIIQFPPSQQFLATGKGCLT